MADFYNLLRRDSANWQNCQTALTEKGIDMTAVPTDDFAGKIREIVIAKPDGLETAAELRNFPDIRAGLAALTAKIIVLRGGGDSLAVTITLPAGKTGTIDFGDGDVRMLTAAGAPITYHKTWSVWRTAANAGEDYQLLTITGEISAVAAAASPVAATIHWANVLWIAVRSTALTTFALSNSPGIIPYCLRRIDFDTPNLLLNSGVFYGCNALQNIEFNGKFGNTSGANLFTGTDLNHVEYANAAANSVSGIVSGGRNYSLSVSVSVTQAVSFSYACANNSMLRRFSTNAAWGSFLSAFSACYCLKELDFSGCPVNGITDFTGNINLRMLQKLLFPSTGSGTSRSPKAFAAAMTSMGNIDISNSGLSRDALIEMFRSLPVNASSRNLTVTGSVGAADLSAEDIALATAKNWVLIR